MSQPANLHSMDPAPRIGDAEREQAVALLRDHMVAGRLEGGEFDDRIGRALSARTQPELDALFTDLPQAATGQAVAPLGEGATVGLPPEGEDEVFEPNPWWVHWGLFVAALMLSMVSRGRLGPLVPVAAMWVWWLGPSIVNQQHQRRAFNRQQRRRELGR